jgi:DNA-binding LacI/PurR family transcriptional regulator
LAAAGVSAASLNPSGHLTTLQALGSRRPSIADVARLAGVSRQTVSRVLNNQPDVNDATRARVRGIIDQLDYRPSSAARALASGRSKTLGVLALDLALYGPTSTLFAVQHAAQERGYFAFPVVLHAIDRHSVSEAVRRLTTQSVEGLVMNIPFDLSYDPLASLPKDMRVVVIGGGPGAAHSEHVVVVDFDQELGGRLATEHLLAAGNATVFHVSGPSHSDAARSRVSGWRAALRDAGAEVMPPLSGDWSALSGYDAGQVLARIPDVHAIFVANDQMALGVLRALHERGRRVPEDVAVVGFDDTPEAACFVPPLTTVRQDFRELGQVAVQILVDQLMAGSTGPHRVVIQPELICRQSSLSGH